MAVYGAMVRHSALSLLFQALTLSGPSRSEYRVSICRAILPKKNYLTGSIGILNVPLDHLHFTLRDTPLLETDHLLVKGGDTIEVILRASGGDCRCCAEKAK